MGLISKVEIKRFRSIVDQSFQAADLTIFSGLNNSGKSNVLRALNLFFNDESGFAQPYNFDTDYNKAFTGRVGGRREMSIAVHFNGIGNAALSKHFWIKKTYYLERENTTEYFSEDLDIQEKINKGDGNVQRQFTTFLNKIVYSYIPAVRDKLFVRKVFLEFEKMIDHSARKDFYTNIGNISEILGNTSKEMSRDFESFLKVPTRAVLLSQASDILGTVEVNIETGIEIKRGNDRKSGIAEVNLFSAGDGILMSYLAYFFAHMSRKITSKHYIWGFEEPENSLEYSKVQSLAKNFLEQFSKSAQIFITTHSPAFVKLREESNVAFYRVYIEDTDPKRSSQLRTVQQIEERQMELFGVSGDESPSYRKLMQEMNFIEYAAEVEAAVERANEAAREHREEARKHRDEVELLKKLRPAKVFICEDSEKAILQFWREMLARYNLSNVVVFTSGGSTQNRYEEYFKILHEQVPGYEPVVFRQLDRDGLTDKQIDAIESVVLQQKKLPFPYMHKYFTVNEVENFAVLADSALFDDAFWNTNKEVIQGEFEKTAESLLQTYLKKFDKKSDPDNYSLFVDEGGGRVPIIQGMRKNAVGNWRCLMPGKRICKLVPNYNAIRKLLGLKNDLIPSELSSYMSEVVKFYSTH